MKHALVASVSCTPYGDCSISRPARNATQQLNALIAAPQQQHYHGMPIVCHCLSVTLRGFTSGATMFS